METKQQKHTELQAQRYFDMLKRLTLYQSVEHLRKFSEDEWGVPFHEALEMAYENMREDARRAIARQRRPEIEKEK